MLVAVKAPKPLDEFGHRAEGMIIDKVDVTPGQPPPFLIPHCWSCREMVESFTIDWIASPFFLPIQFHCHGKTGGMKVSYIDVIRASHEGGGLLWVFKESTNGKQRIRKP